jgi:hypothetical protein
MRRTVSVLLVVAAMVCAGCSSSLDTYPFPDATAPYHSSQITPAVVGQPSGVQWLTDIEPKPGDVIDLVNAEPEGSLDGAAVELWLSPQVLQGTTFYCGDHLEQIPGAELKAAYASPGPANNFCIVGQITSAVPGVYTLANIRMQYRLNHGDVRVAETGGVVWTVCVDTPAPACRSPG